MILFTLLREGRCFAFPGHRMSHHLKQMLALVVIAAQSMHFGCVTSKPEMSRQEMAWVRTDGRRIVDDLALLHQGKTDIAVCHANLDTGAVDEKARECMTSKRIRSSA